MRRLLIAAALLLAPMAWAQTIADFVVPDGREIMFAFVDIRPSATQRRPPPYETDPDTDLTISGGGLAEITIRDWFFNATTLLNTTLRRTGSVDFAEYFGDDDGDPAGIFPTSQLTLMTSSDTVTLPIQDCGGGFCRWAPSGRPDPDDDVNFPGVTPSQFLNTRVVVVVTVVSAAPSDNCNLYIGGVDLTAPGDFRVGGSTPVRMYLGDDLVCGAEP